MRMLDSDDEKGVRCLQLYLTAKEAKEIHKGLDFLLRDPEDNEHVHVFSKDGLREISFSIVTPTKLASGGYTELEQRIFDEEL